MARYSAHPWQPTTWIRARARLVLLTNGIASVQRGRLGRSALCDAFDHVVISEETGYAKPDPRIFEVGVARAGLSDRTRMIVVGDSLTSDIQGGVNFGIDSCWYNPAKRRLPPDSPSPSHEIAHLAQIKEILR